MAARKLVLLLFLTLVSSPAFGAEAVSDYEARLEDISREVESIRQELEALVAEVVEGEAGRVHVFVEGLPPAWNGAGVALYLDGVSVFSRPFTTAEQEVLKRGLPLELGAWRLLAGDHRVSLVPLGGEAGEGQSFPVPRGSTKAWVATPGETGFAWRVE